MQREHGVYVFVCVCKSVFFPVTPPPLSPPRVFTKRYITEVGRGLTSVRIRIFDQVIRHAAKSMRLFLLTQEIGRTHHKLTENSCSKRNEFSLEKSGTKSAFISGGRWWKRDQTRFRVTYFTRLPFIYKI